MRGALGLVASAVSGFVVGAVALGMYEAKQCRLVATEYARSAPVGMVIADVNTLTSLRDGQIERVISDREQDLSYQLQMLAPDIAATPPKDPSIAKAVRLAAAYRLKHPFKLGNADVDAAVEEVLATAATNRPPTKQP
jgi:hypothetical protein